MKVNNELVKKISFLARIELTEEELENISNSLRGIVSMVEQVNEEEGIDYNNKIERDFSLKNLMRNDEVVESTNIDDLINSFPEKEGRYLKTKKIIDN